jgi:putative flippase GtrA
MLKFTLFSASAGIIQVGSFTLLNELAGLIYWPAYLISLILSIIWNFTLNRRYTFKSAANVPIAMAKVFGFYLIFTPLSTWLGHLAETGGVNEYIVLAVTMLSNFVLEFLFCKVFVYKGKEDTLEK